MACTFAGQDPVGAADPTIRADCGLTPTVALPVFKGAVGSDPATPAGGFLKLAFIKPYMDFDQLS